MTKEKESCISDLRKIITRVAANLINEAAKKDIYLSFDANKFDNLFSFYEEIKDSIKKSITDKKFLINKYKISSIISLSLCSKHLISGEGEKQTEYYNFYLSLLVSEQFMKQFSEDDESHTFIKFRKDFHQSTLKMIKINSSLINNSELYKNNHIVLSCVVNLSHQYNLLYALSIEKEKV